MGSYRSASSDSVGAGDIASQETTRVAAEIGGCDIGDRRVGVVVLANILVIASVVAVNNELVEAEVSHARWDQSGRSQKSRSREMHLVGNVFCKKGLTAWV